jgi:hypothetical protein
MTQELKPEKVHRKPGARKLKLVLFILAIFATVIDMRLAASHRAHAFHVFRKPHQIFPVFVFGVSCWAFILALPLGLVPFRKMTYQNRYVCSALFLILIMDLIYLLSFTYMSLRH